VRRFLAACMACALLAGCRDDGADVRNVGPDGSSGSATGPVDGRAALGGYQPASDLGAVAKISQDACDIAGLMPEDRAPDFAAATTIYADGRHAFEPRGRRLSFRGFAIAPPERPTKREYDVYFGDPAWLDTYVAGALSGTGPFAGQPDAVRRKAVLTGVEVAIPIAWALDELDSARASVDEPGGTDPDTGAPHSVDRAWAFYRGDVLTCAPFFTASNAGQNLGTGATIPDAIRLQMRRAVEAAQSGDAGRLRVASDEVRRLFLIAHTQAVIEACLLMDEAAEAGDQSSARIRQTEAWTLFRVVEPFVSAKAPATARTIAGRLDLRAQPGSGTGSQIRTALEAAYPALGITKAEIGTPDHERSTP
jgi:low iron-inducible protein